MAFLAVSAAVVVGVRFAKRVRADLAAGGAGDVGVAARMPATRIADVTDGTLVRVVGRVVMPAAPLLAPWTRRPCVAYSLYVEGADERRVLELAEVTPFVIVDDAGGRALVHPGRTSIQYTYDANEHSSFFHDGEPSFRDFLVRNGLPVAGLIAPLPYRCHEGVIEPGEEITVIGVARHEMDPDGQTRGYRDQPMRAVFRVHRGSPPTVIDGPARWQLR